MTQSDSVEHVAVRVGRSNDLENPVKLQFESVENPSRNFVWHMTIAQSHRVAAGIRRGEMSELFDSDTADQVASDIERQTRR